MTQTKITLDRMDEMMREVFKELQSRGNRAKAGDVLPAIAPRLSLTDYEREATSSGAVRWDTHVRFYTADCVRAGFMQKANGYWTLTPEGVKALELPKGQLIRAAGRGYTNWRKGQTVVAPVVPDGVAELRTTYEKAEEAAQAAIEAHIDGLDAYELQNLVAELLTAMGYHVRRVAAPGPDGGIDIDAYKDPLGMTAPRIRCQVKHRPGTKVAVKDVRELAGLLRQDGEMGLYVSTGGFTAEAEREMRGANKHVEAIDGERLVELWKEHYAKVSEQGKALLPLVPVYFVAPTES